MIRGVLKDRIFKLPIAVTAIVTVGVAAGLGTAAVLQKDTGPVTPPPVLVEQIGNVGAFDGMPSAEERALAARPDVRQGIGAITADAPSVPDALLPGERVGPVRVSLAHLGDAGRAIWMYRTARGKVCYGLTDFTAGCVEQLPVGQVINPVGGDPGDGGGMIVWGFAVNKVRSVNVIVNGESQAAVFGRNAFFFQAPSTTARISAVVAKTADGSTVTVPVSLPRTTTSDPIEHVFP